MSNYQKILAVFGIMLSLIILVLLWAFVINKGTLIIKGSAPFSVNYGKPKSILCTEAPCEIKLTGGKYTITLSKDSFYPEQFEAKIKFRKSVEHEVNFIFIPKIQELGQRNYINIPKNSGSYVNNLNDSSFVVGKTVDLTNLPKIFEEIFFDKLASSALVKNKEDYWFLNLRTLNLEKLNINNLISKAWDLDSNLYYLEEKDGDFFLKAINEKNEAKLIVKFQKALRNIDLYISPKGKFSLIIEKESPYNWYLINNEKKTRHKIDANNEIQNPSEIIWSSDEASIWINKDNKNWSLIVENESFEEIKEINAKFIFPYINKQFLVIESLEENGANLIFNKGIDNRTKVSLKTGEKFTELRLGLYDNTNKSYKVSNIELNQVLTIEKFEMKNERLYFLAGEKIYEIILKE